MGIWVIVGSGAVEIQSSRAEGNGLKTALSSRDLCLVPSKDNHMLEVTIYA